MKILYIANSRIPTEKAHGLQIMKMSEAFLLQGHKVSLLIPRRENSIKDSPQVYYSLKKVPDIVYVPNVVGFLEKYFHHTYFFIQRFIFGITACLYALKSDADIIFSREISVCFLLSIVGKKVVFEDHEPKKRLRFMYTFFIQKIWKKIIVPHALADLYAAHGVRKDTYIIAPNGVDLDQFKNILPNRNVWKELGIDPDQKIVLYIGHFYAWKGVYTLLDAFDRVTNAVLVLIGRTVPDREKIEAYINEKNISQTHVYPHMVHDKVIAFLKSADVLVLPNTGKEERSLMYTTPLKLFEYMASLVPIVASDIPSFNPYIKDNKSALLYKSDDSFDLSRRLNEIIVDEIKAKKIAADAYLRVEEYTWEKRARNILNFISVKTE